MKKVIFATNNKYKLAEILPFLHDFVKARVGEECEILTLADLNVNIDIEEFTESLFCTNAGKKAKETYNQLIKLDKINVEDIVLTDCFGLFGKSSGYPGAATKKEFEEHGLEKMLEKLILKEQEKNPNINPHMIKVCYVSIFVFYSKDFQKMYDANEDGVVMDKSIGNYNYPLDRYFKSDKRGNLGELTPAKLSKSSFRQNGTNMGLTRQVFQNIEILEFESRNKLNEK